MPRINAYGRPSQTKTAKTKLEVKASASGEKVSCCYNGMSADLDRIRQKEAMMMSC